MDQRVRDRRAPPKEEFPEYEAKPDEDFERTSSPELESEQGAASDVEVVDERVAPSGGGAEAAKRRTAIQPPRRDPPQQQQQTADQAVREW